MPDGFFFKDPREARTPFNDSYVVMGIVGVCLLMALVLLGAGMLDPVEKTPPAAQLYHAVGHSSTGYHAAKHPTARPKPLRARGLLPMSAGPAEETKPASSRPLT